MQAREPEPVQAQQLAAEQLERVQVQAREPVRVLEQPRVLEPLAPEPRQARELRVSRQLEL